MVQSPWGASGGGNFGNAVHNEAFSTATSPYYSVTFTPDSNYYLSFSGFDFGTRSTATGAKSFAIYSSLDSYATPLSSGTISVSPIAWALKQPTLSIAGSSSDKGTPVTLRLYTYDGLVNAGSGTINNRIDDVKITVNATFVPSASRDIVWKATSDTWAIGSGTAWSLKSDGSSTVYQEGDHVNFNRDAGGTVTLNSAVNPGSMTVSATTGTYTFTGNNTAPIGGPIAKSNAGGLNINSTVQNTVAVSGGSLGGSGTIGALTMTSGTVSPGSTFSNVGTLNLSNGGDLSGGGTYLWNLGSLTSSGSGTAGTNWDLLNLTGGSLNFGGLAKLALGFNSNEDPNSGNNPNNFWNQNHSWLIAQGASGITIGGNILNPTNSFGTFSLAASGSSELMLNFSNVRTLTWSASSTTTASDGPGNWTDANKWTTGAALVTFDSNRPDNAILGAGTGTSGSASVSLSGTSATVGSLTFAASSAQYTLSGGSVTITSGVTANQSATIGSLVILGSSQAWNVSTGTLAVGSISELSSPVALTKSGSGLLVLSGTSTYTGGTVLSAGTTSISSPGNIGSGKVSFTGVGYDTTLRFTSPMTLSNDIQFPLSAGSKFCWLDTQGNDVTLTGQLWPTSGTAASASFDKAGSGTLTLAAGDTTGQAKGTTYIKEGTIRITGVDSFGYSALTNINVYAGTALHLDNVLVGRQSDTSLGAQGYVDLFNGATLKGSGTSSYAHGDISPVLNYTSTGKIYSPGSGTIQTVGSSDVLSILNSVKQFDPGSQGANNNYGNAIKTGSASYASDPTKQIVMHVTGLGRVQLQDGGVSSYSTFGGDWSVDQGVLQVGPYQTGFPGWKGPYGQVLNALGFKTVNGQAYPGMKGDPDMPNGVTVNSGGMFAVAVDQPNTNPSITFGPQNGTPDYLRNPITLSGGTLAATGYGALFTSSSDDVQGMQDTNHIVKARLGGDFTVSTGTSTIATYDPIGGTGARTVQLLYGSRTLSNSTPGFTAGTKLTYNTTWKQNSTLNVDGGNHGGEFDLFRDSDGGTVTVESGAKINILHGATVNVGGTELNAALYDTGGSKSVNFTTGEGGGHLVFDRTEKLIYRGNISGGLDLKKSGSGLLVLSGTNNYTGGTTVSNGTLAITSASALPEGYSLTVGAGGTLIFDPSAAFGSSMATNSSFAGTAMVAVPEPASLAMLLSFAGCAGAFWLRRRAKR